MQWQFFVGAQIERSSPAAGAGVLCYNHMEAGPDIDLLVVELVVCRDLERILEDRESNRLVVVGYIRMERSMGG
jgi:hypothetical protein